MLRSLQIRDFVIVDRLELEFSGGFGALTGETGAGKSILLGALSLVLGARADPGVVRAGCERAEISAEFDSPRDPQFADWLDDQGLSAGEEGLLLRRVVDAGGRSRAWINGSAVTLTQMRELGDGLADIHGQHAHHALLRADVQRRLVDASAQCEVLAEEVLAHHRAWRAAVEASQQAHERADGLARERELLEWQHKELSELGFDADEWQALELEQARLGHAAGLLEAAGVARATLVDSEPAIVGELESMAARLSQMAEVDPQLDEFAALLQSAAIQAGEAAHGLGRYCERLDLDPQRLAELDARIARVTEVARKYRVEPAELPALLERTSDELEAICIAGDPQELSARERECRQAYLSKAKELSAKRQVAAAALEKDVTEAMQSLAMAGGRFEVALLAQQQGAAFGLEQIEFRVAASEGQALRALGKVASGGELSRIGLAIQVIASRGASTPTLIFDEVDVGVGGRVAEIVGHMLARLGEDRQVLCVTHLPQVAAQAHWQWSISKHSVEGETLSRVAVLDEAARVEEIARMLGGVEITRTTREHASEMLAQRSSPSG